MIVVLHNVRSMHNVGSIFRTADAAGCEKIYLCGITPTPINEFKKPRQQITKVSLGAENHISWEKCKNIYTVLKNLQVDGYKIFAVEQSKDSMPYYKVKLSKAEKSKAVLVLGHEIKGLSKTILSKADKILEIPMRGAIIKQAHHPRRIDSGKESLNVSVAFGIVIFSLIYN